MNGKIGILLGVLLIFILCFTFTAFAAEEEEDERLELIRASRKLTEEQSRIYYNKVGLFATNFGAEDGGVNLGGRIEIPFPESENVKFVTEGIYLNDIKEFSGFLSLKVDPLPESMVAPYLGAGLEVLGQANYQAFAGVDIWDNFFAEAKYINQEGDFGDSDLYLATGIQLNF
ncbi:MAG: hypothetical protein ACOCQN_00930 [Halanaerobiaceae bacterium]